MILRQSLSTRYAFAFLLAASPVGVASAAPPASAPSVSQALSLAPIQTGVDYAKPTKADIARCTIKPEREGKSTSWIVRDGSGQTLRKFADTNADNVVDMWSYYQNGLEVYRDVDADFDSKADEYRWLHTGGSRWGIDRNEDGKIDSWKQISPQEVAEEAVLAVQQKDEKRFARLLITRNEARQIGLGNALAGQIAKQVAVASKEFASLTRSQKVIDAKSRFVDFGASRPGVVPKGVDGSTKDITVYENTSALIDSGGAPEQLLLGSLFKVGDAWRLVEAPRAGTTGPELANVFSVPSYAASASAAAPDEKIQTLMLRLEKLDRQAASATAAQRPALTDQRVAALEKLAISSTDLTDARQWYMQLAGLLNAAVQTDGYQKGLAKLAALERSPGVKRIGKDLVAHFRYQQIGAKHGLAYRDPKAKFTKIQKAQLADLEAFVDAFPTSPDAADAMLQLGNMAGEFTGEIEDAEKWYTQAAQEFPRTAAGKKAAGALRRLGSIGKVLPLSGDTLDGRRLDLAAAPYRGKHVLIYYWTTWSSPERDMAQIEKLRKEYRGKLEVIGVNLDNSPATAKTFAAKQRLSWKHLYDEAGIDGDRANQMGVINLPLMLLVDNRGNVANRNLHAGELETELQRVIR